MTDSPSTPVPAFTAHRVQRDRGSLAVRDFPGSGPAFVVLHGFPDNSHIYDDLIPHLVLAGRRTVAVDFLGFGASDKPQGAHYSFEQQLGDLEAVVETLALDRIIPVGHDAGGPAAVNFALKHPERTAAVCLMNAFYGEAPGLTEAQKARYTDFLGPIIDGNFRQQPSAGPAFAKMTYQLSDEVAANTARLLEFRRSGVPFLLIWGKCDPYLHVSVAEYMRSNARNATLHILEAGHWPQIDAAADVARILLAGP